jgi:DUF1680 family protein
MSVHFDPPLARRQRLIVYQNRCDSSGLLFNWFGPGELTCKLSDGRDVELRLKTDYPRESRVLIEVQPLAAQQFALRLRIPYWSANTVVKLNGQSLGAVTPGAYLALDRR